MLHYRLLALPQPIGIRLGSDGLKFVQLPKAVLATRLEGQVTVIPVPRLQLALLLINVASLAVPLSISFFLLPNARLLISEPPPSPKIPVLLLFVTLFSIRSKPPASIP